VTELERKVLEYVRAHPGLSGSRIAREIARNKAETLRALRSLEGRGMISTLDSRPDGARTGSRGGWHIGPGKSSTFSAEPKDALVAGDRKSVIAREFAALRKLLERRERRAA
jgi:hypothetical protein